MLEAWAKGDLLGFGGLGHSWASLAAQRVKNPPEMQETWLRSLAQEDPLEESRQATPVFLLGESPWTEEPGELQSVASQSRTQLSY